MKVKIYAKFLITILFIIIMLLGASTSSLANYEYSVSMALTSNSTNIKEGEVITVNVNLTNVNAGNGIDALCAKLNYDTNVFEILSPSNFSSNTNWNVSFAPSTNMLTAIKNTKVKNGENIFNIRLKVKSNINVSSTNVSLQNIQVSGGMITMGGTGDINVNNISINFKKAENHKNNKYNTTNKNSVTMKMSSNSSLKEGEIVTIKVDLTNINAGNGIDALSAKLNYDTNVFEILSPSNFSSNTNWNISFAPSTNMLTAIKNTKVKNGENMFNIKLKVKSNINVNSTNISLQNIQVSGGIITMGGTGDINVNNIYVTLNKVIGETNTSKKSSTDKNLGILQDNNYINDIDIDNNTEIYDISEDENVDIDENGNINENSNIDESNQLKHKLYMNENNNIDILKVNQISQQKISTNRLDQNINGETINVKRTVIGSSSTVSFISICFYLFRKLKLGM